MLHKLLLRARREGARATQLLRHTPELIDFLVPSAEHPEWTDRQRADETEAILRLGLMAFGQEEDELEGRALAIEFRLAPGTKRLNLTDRRSRAGEKLGLAGETFRTPKHESALIFDFAVVVDRVQDRRNGS